MGKKTFYTGMDSKEKREWWLNLIGILCGLAGCFYLFYALTMFVKKAILHL